MTLGQKVLKALEETKQRGTLEHTAGGRVSVPQGSAQVTLDIADFDRLGLLLNGICIVWDPALSAADTRARAEHIVQRVTYLTEDFTWVEWAEQSESALLRSAPQEMQGERSDYFELLLRGGRVLDLRRYRPCGESAGREEVAFHLATDLLVRLLNDLVGPPTAEPQVTV